MRVRLGELKAIICEALTPAATGEFVRALERVGGVNVNLDTYGSMTNVFVTLLGGDPDEVEARLLAVADRHGWSLLSRNDRRGPTWWFEPKPETKGPLPRKRIPATLYHITGRGNLEGIMSQGLVPGRRTSPGTLRRYADRTYLASSPKATRGMIKDTENAVVLEVDTTVLPKNVRFYVDQEFGIPRDGMPRSVFTTSVIPPAAISVRER